MKVHTKISYKKLLTMSLIIFSSYEMKSKELNSLENSTLDNQPLNYPNIKSVTRDTNSSFTTDDEATAIISAITTLVTSTLSTSANISALARDNDVSGLNSTLISMNSNIHTLGNSLLATANQVNTLLATVSALNATLLDYIANQQTTTSPYIESVNSCANNDALTTLVTSDDTEDIAVTILAKYNIYLNTALVAIITATTTQSADDITTAQFALQDAINEFNALSALWIIDGSMPSSAYSVDEIETALTALSTTLSNLAAAQ
jgi:hypothetical protein